MTIVAKAIIAASQAAASQTTQYTTPASTRTIIDKLTGTNTTAATATLAVNLVPSAGSAGASNLIATKALAPGETYTFPEVVGHVLNPGDFISTIAGTAAAVTLRASGREVT